MKPDIADIFIIGGAMLIMLLLAAIPIVAILARGC